MNRIHLYIKRNPLPEELYLQFMLLLGFFFGYFEVTVFWNAGIILLTGWLLVSSKRIQRCVRKNPMAILLLFGLVCFIVLNILYMGTGAYLSYNLIQIVRPMVILCGIFYISKEKSNIISDFLERNFKLLNLMWVVNLSVLGLQVAGTGFMIKASWMAANSFYKDNCTGLFGGSSTHVVLLFTIFITIYNLEVGINRFIAEWKKKAFYVYIFGTLGLMLLFSTLNDNTAMFVFTPIFLAWYYLHKLKVVDTSLFNKILGILKYVFGALILLFVLQFIPGVSDFINTTVMDKIEGVINFKNTNGLGSVERLAIASDALNRGFGWKWGLGLGTWNIVGGRYAGFLHFGLSSVGSFIYLMGIWGYLIITVVYAYFMSHMRNEGEELSFGYLQNKRTSRAATSSMTGAAVNLLIDVILIKAIGLFAAALSTYVGFLVMWVVRMYDIRKDWPIKVKKVKFITLTLISTLVATVTIWTSVKDDITITCLFGGFFLVLNKNHIILILKKVRK